MTLINVTLAQRRSDMTVCLCMHAARSHCTFVEARVGSADYPSAPAPWPLWFCDTSSDRPFPRASISAGAAFRGCPVQVSPTHVRGALGSVSQLVVCIGILVALVVNVALPASSWRTMFAIATVPAVVLALGDSC